MNKNQSDDFPKGIQTKTNTNGNHGFQWSSLWKTGINRIKTGIVLFGLLILLSYEYIGKEKQRLIKIHKIKMNFKKWVGLYFSKFLWLCKSRKQSATFCLVLNPGRKIVFQISYNTINFNLVSGQVTAVVAGGIWIGS